MDAMAEHRRLENYGLELLQRTIAVLNSVIPDDPSLPGANAMHHRWARGPDFDYEAAWDLFLGRRGAGPLYVAWDTNILLDYFEYGAMLWKGGDLPGRLSEEHLSDLECLQLVMALWVIRDIRFVVLSETIDDAKKKLSQEPRSDRLNAFMEFTNSLQLTPDGLEGEISTAGLLILPDSIIGSAMNHIPCGLDRLMVSAAHRYGAHIYATRDKKVQRGSTHFSALGLAIVSPGELFERLLGTGAFGCVLNPRLAYWPLPDQQRVAHLIRALPNYGL